MYAEDESQGSSSNSPQSMENSCRCGHWLYVVSPQLEITLIDLISQFSVK